MRAVLWIIFILVMLIAFLQLASLAIVLIAAAFGIGGIESLSLMLAGGILVVAGLFAGVLLLSPNPPKGVVMGLGRDTRELDTRCSGQILGWLGPVVGQWPATGKGREPLSGRPKAAGEARWPMRRELGRPLSG